MKNGWSPRQRGDRSGDLKAASPSANQRASLDNNVKTLLRSLITCAKLNPAFTNSCCESWNEFHFRGYKFRFHLLPKLNWASRKWNYYAVWLVLKRDQTWSVPVQHSKNMHAPRMPKAESLGVTCLLDAGLKHSRSSLVFRICHDSFSECSIGLQS